MDARDSQKQKLYDAEHACRKRMLTARRGGEDESHPFVERYFLSRQRHEDGRVFVSPKPDTDAVRAYVAELTLDPGYRELFPAGNVRKQLPNDPWAIEVKFDANNQHSARGGQASIKLPSWAHRELVVLHEVAHNLVSSSVPGHGWEFAAAFLKLVTYKMGPEAGDALREEFERGGVRYRRDILRDAANVRRVIRERVKEWGWQSEAPDSQMCRGRVIMACGDEFDHAWVRLRKKDGIEFVDIVESRRSLDVSVPLYDVAYVL